MASNIVPGNVDATYPKAGQDNSSQGLRDNFNSIKNNFTEAKSEIEAMQTNKANLNSANNFNGVTIQNAVMQDNGEVVYSHGTVGGGAIALNFENGHYQTATITADTTFSFLNFPSGSCGRFTLDLTVNAGATTLTFPSAIMKATNVHGSDGTSDQVAPGIGRVLYEFISADSGVTVLMHQLGRQYA